MEAAEHRAEIIRADGQHRGKADRGIHRIAPADPIPELEHIGGINAELGDFGGVGGDGDEMLGDGLFIAAQAGERPVARGVRVGHGFERGESFRGDDPESFRGIYVAHGFGEIGAINIGDETKRQGALAVVSERFVGHHRAEIGAADADINDIANAFAGVAYPVLRCGRDRRSWPSCRARRERQAPRFHRRR